MLCSKSKDYSGYSPDQLTYTSVSRLPSTAWDIWHFLTTRKKLQDQTYIPFFSPGMGSSSSCITECGGSDCRPLVQRLMREPEDKETVSMHRYEHAEATATPDTTVESTWGSQMPPLPPVMPGLVLHDGFLEDEALEMPEDPLDRQEISGFIRDLVRGRTLPVVAVNGTAVECLVAMDKQLRYMVIQRTGKKEAKRRALALETVDQICVGTEALEDSGLPLTEMCVCLLLTEGQADQLQVRAVELAESVAELLKPGEFGDWVLVDDPFLPLDKPEFRALKCLQAHHGLEDGPPDIPPELARKMDKSLVKYARDGDPSLLVWRVPATLTEDGLGEMQTYALPILSRSGGILLAIPDKLLSSEAILDANLNDESAMIGPSREFTAQLMMEEDIGSGIVDLDVTAVFLVVDVEDSTLEAMREYDPVTDSQEVIFPFYETEPNALPKLTPVIPLVKEWIETMAHEKLHFYSAREEPTTLATLATQMATMQQQLQAVIAHQDVLAKGGGALDTFAGPATAQTNGPMVAKIPALSAGLAHGTPAKTATAALGPPPRTRRAAEPAPDAVQTSSPIQGSFVAGGEQQVINALSQQSVAITQLVAHLAGGDPMSDLASSSASTGLSLNTKGVARREKMQSDLAQRTSNYFLQVQQQLFKRMNPSRAIPKNAAELSQVDVSMTSYLERYGGFKQCRDTGLTMWILAHAMDSAAKDDFHGTKEYLALLTAALEQSALDNSWGVAYVLSLMEGTVCGRGDACQCHWQALCTSGSAQLGGSCPQLPQGAGGLGHKEDRDEREHTLTGQSSHSGGRREPAESQPKAEAKVPKEAKSWGRKPLSCMDDSLHEHSIEFKEEDSPTTPPLQFVPDDPLLVQGGGGRQDESSHFFHKNSDWRELLESGDMQMSYPRWLSDDELKREPNPEHLTLYRRVSSLIRSDGRASSFSIAKSGRKHPELVAKLGELSGLITAFGMSGHGYSKSFAGVVEVPARDKAINEIIPYSDLQASRLRIYGTGQWDVTSHLADDLVMAYREPRSLLADLSLGPHPLCRDSAEEVARLAHLWDKAGLLRLHQNHRPLGSLVKIFNCYKNEEVDRQIGDRRGQNSLECRVTGPSHDLPAGPDLMDLQVQVGKQKVVVIITDRKDYYHQLWCSNARSSSNAVGPAVHKDLLVDTQAYSAFCLQSAMRKRRTRVLYGDDLHHFNLHPGEAAEGEFLPPDHFWVCFGSVLQGDHAGVEVATSAHENWLKTHGLLDEYSRLVASRCLRSENLAQGLVIDDYFAASVESVDTANEHSLAANCYRVSQAAYESADLLGSPSKDEMGGNTGKLVGAFVNSGHEALSRGLCTVGSPAEKRIGISFITLILCSMAFTTDALHLCLLGGWVSILSFRRPLMSILSRCYHLVDQNTLDANVPKLVRLPRSAANELVLLAALAPLAVSDLGAEYLPYIYATDASMFKGAICQALQPAAVVRALWKSCKSKGSYTRILTPAELVLRSNGLFDEEKLEQKQPAGPERPLAYEYDFIEVFSGASLVSAAVGLYGWVVGPPLDIGISEEYNLASVHVIEWLTFLLASKRLKAVMVSPPCTTFSIMRRPRLRSRLCPFGFNLQDPQTMLGNVLGQRGAQILYIAAANDAAGILETTYSSYLKFLPGWQAVKNLDAATEVRADSCAFGSVHLKPFRLLGVNVEMGALAKRCCCNGPHVRVEGAYTKASATYVPKLAATLAECLHGAILKVQLRRVEELDLQVAGLENQLVNEVALSASWEVHSRSSSRALSAILRRVGATCVAAALYFTLPYVPTRWNPSDDPTRDADLRPSYGSLGLESWEEEDIYLLSEKPKTKKWASMWLRMVLRLLGPKCLHFSDRSQFRQTSILKAQQHGHAQDQMDFDGTLGFPGEGHMFLFWIFHHFPQGFWICEPVVSSCSDHFALWNLASPLLSLLILLGFLSPLALRWNAAGCSWVLPLSKGKGLWIFVVVFACLVSGAPAMPLFPRTAGERSKAAFRRARPPVPAGRPVLPVTTKRREQLLNEFFIWATEEGLDVLELFENHHRYIDDTNLVLERYGRTLYECGRSYGKYAETINAITSWKPAIRRMLQGAWDFGYGWCRHEPSTHHSAMPGPIALAVISTCIIWGWTRLAGSIAIMWAGLLRPGELLAATRADLLLPQDGDFTVPFGLLAIRDPKTRFSNARHQSAKIDMPDMLRVVELFFGSLQPHQRLWPFSGQTLRTRFHQVLSALKLPLVTLDGVRPMELSSIRAGAATWIMQTTESADLLQRRGRWANRKMMDIYVQEVTALVYLKKAVAFVFQNLREYQKSADFKKVVETVEKMDDYDMMISGRVLQEILVQAGLAEAHHRLRTFKNSVKLIQKGIKPQEIREAIINQKIELVLTAHPTEAQRRSALKKHEQMLQQMKVHDGKDQLTPGQLSGLYDKIKAIQWSCWRTNTETVWKAVPEHYRRLDRCLTRIGASPLPFDASILKMSSWMGGDRDGNPNVTWEVTKKVVTLLRWRVVELYYREVDELLYELSMDGEVNEEMRAEVDAVSSMWTASAPGSKDEPYRRLLMAIRRRCWRTKVSMEALYMGKQNDPDFEKEVLTSAEELARPLEIMYRSLIEQGDEIVANGRLLDLIRRVRTFGISMACLDVRQESDRHSEVMDTLTSFLGLGKFTEWTEQERCDWLEIESKRPLLAPDMPMSDIVKEILDTYKAWAVLGRPVR
eukprot:s990_g22.t1